MYELGSLSHLFGCKLTQPHKYPGKPFRKKIIKAIVYPGKVKRWKMLYHSILSHITTPINIDPWRGGPWPDQRILNRNKIGCQDSHFLHSQKLIQPKYIKTHISTILDVRITIKSIAPKCSYLNLLGDHQSNLLQSSGMPPQITLTDAYRSLITGTIELLLNDRQNSVGDKDILSTWMCTHSRINTMTPIIFNTFQQIISLWVWPSIVILWLPLKCMCATHRHLYW